MSGNNLSPGVDVYAGTKPMAKVVLIYWAFGFVVVLLASNSPDSILSGFIINNSAWVRKILPAINVFAQISSIKNITLCFFSLMWLLFPVFLIFLYRSFPDVVESKPINLLKGMFLGGSMVLMLIWFLALNDKPMDVGVTHSRGAYAMQMLVGSRVGLSVVATAFIALLGFMCVAVLKFASKLLRLLRSVPT